MALSPGTRLGSYEVIALLGAGGMGEVYRARDTKLGREVALKVLPESFTHDPERLARFNREAQVLASLNHPHIAAIYELHESGAIQFLVLELVQGETLACHLANGPLPMGEALAIAQQIAEALQAAHDKGITHRDLKPANVALTAERRVKVLDFGLAKTRELASGTGDLASSPTVMSPLGMTQAGVLLGTAAYMSPEQATGRTADHRSDIWSFGCILAEMLTGRQVFARETISETLAAVLRDEPDLAQLPNPARRLVHACLHKDPAHRLHAIGDARLLFETVGQETASTSNRWPWALAAASVVATGLALWAPWRDAASDHPQPALRLDLDLGWPVAQANLGPDVILSPDGTRLVLVAQSPDGKSRLVTRRVDEPLAVELRGTEGAYTPFFSPDAQWVAFFAAGKLKKSPLGGGNPVVLCDAPAGRGGSWGDDGNIVATLETQKGLSVVESKGGPPAALTMLAPGENSHRWPQVLPGAKAVLFTSNKTYSNFDESTISAVSLADRRSKVVLERAGMHPQYVASGHLIYVTKGTLYAVPFDPVRLEVHGSSVAVLDDVSNDTAFGFSRVGVSASGILLYRTGRTEGQRTIFWLDGTGNLDSLDVEPAVYQFPRISPDGSRIIWMMNQGSRADLWVYDWRRGSKTRLTDGQDVYAYPAWSPDGRYIVFSSSRGILWTRPDGAGKPHPLVESKALLWPTSFSPDGKRLVYSELNPTGGLIRTIPLDDTGGQLRAGASKVFLQTSALPFPAFSPDGRWLAYADAESGRYEVYVRAFPDKGARWLVSSGGGTMPVWSRTARELFYRDEDSRIMVATYSVTGATFVADKPRRWSERRLANTGLTPLFDLAPDGKRFAVLMADEGPEPQALKSHVTLVSNFLEELRRRVPLPSH